MQTVTISSRAGDAKAIIDGRVEHLQEVWLKGQFFEQRMLEYIYWHYKGGTFIDVGSAIGNHSLFFALFCEPRVVVSVEPVRANVERQRALYQLNDVGNVHIYNCALSDQPGRGAMEQFASKNLGQWRLAKGDDVEVLTLDALLEGEDCKRLTLIKIDVEGHELQVLKGAEQTLAERRPAALFIEIRSRAQYKAINDYLAQFRYTRWGSGFQDASAFEFMFTI